MINDIIYVVWSRNGNTLQTKLFLSDLRDIFDQITLPLVTSTST